MLSSTPESLRSGKPCPACGYVDREPARTWHLHFQCKLKSLNKIGSNQKGVAGRAYRNERSSWVARLVRNGALVPRAEGHRQVIITRHYKAPTPGQRDKRKEYDYDNLVGGAKPLVDALRAAKLIKNDHQGAVTVIYKQQPSTTSKPLVTVELQEFDEGTRPPTND